VFGDEDGIIIASEAELVELVAKAEAIKQMEQKVLSFLAEGTDLMSLLNFSEHRERIAAGDKSSMLEFLL
jgi:regulator of RNase E activity RraA